MTAYFIRPFLDLLSLGGLKVMPVSTGSSSLYTLKSFLIAQASPFSDSVSNFLNCLLSFRDYSQFNLIKYTCLMVMSHCFYFPSTEFFYYLCRYSITITNYTIDYLKPFSLTTLK